MVQARHKGMTKPVLVERTGGTMMKLLIAPGNWLKVESEGPGSSRAWVILGSMELNNPNTTSKWAVGNRDLDLRR